MMSQSTEKWASKVIAGGAALTTLFVLSNSVTDPVNAPKLAIAGAFAVSLFSLTLVSERKKFWSQHRFAILVTCFFLLASLNSSIQSKSPLIQNIYGAFGRNSGFVTYFSFSLIFLGALSLRQKTTFANVLKTFAFAGVANLAYCLWVITFGDFIGWNNPYRTILGTFGNPNFIGAFLGMFVSLCFAFIFQPTLSWKLRAVVVLPIVIAVFEIRKSHAVQGLVVSAAGLAIVLFFVIKSRIKKNQILWLYSGLVLILGVVSILGTLQKGPFQFLYKRSVSLRGTYWKTGIEMGNSHPFTGVGMDAYGDWYRRARPQVAVVDTPGLANTSNASHNVFIDFFAFGGWPLILAYLLICLLTIVSIFKVMSRDDSYDPIFVGLTVLWVTYEIQSIISINQIGLAIWGWLIGGVLIAYEKATSVNDAEKEPSIKSRRTTQQVVSPQLIAGIGALVGFFVAAPPLFSDAKFKSALDSKQVQLVEASLQPSFFNWSDSTKYGNAVETFIASNLLEQALKYARIAVKFNPEFSPGWRQLYSLPNSTAEEKAQALIIMKKLDPRNPDVTKY